MSNHANVALMSHCPHCKKPLLANALRLENLLSKLPIKYNFSSRNDQRIQYLVIHDTGRICLACSKVMGVYDQNLASRLPMLDDMNGHAGMKIYLNDGYSCISM